MTYPERVVNTFRSLFPMKTLFFGAYNRKGFKISHIEKTKKISFFEKGLGPVQKFPIFGIFSPINLKN
ncbi:hypothetical protein DP175_02075 [Polynucleobacter paneuropaeus]|nr:hypothetical protein DP175_02075 [Polynucleobacter paneuropaeus]